MPAAAPGKHGIRLVNKAAEFFKKPVNLISVLALLFLGYTIVVPLWEIVSHSVRFNEGGSLIHFDLWNRVLGSKVSESLFYKPMLNSLSIAIGTAVLSLLFGGGLAWLVARTDFAYKKTVMFLAVLPYMLPSWITSFAWLAVFKNDRVGGSKGLIQAVLHVSPPDWLAYGYIPIVITLTLNYFTFFFLLMSVAFSSMNSSLEEMAHMTGAPKRTIMRKITLPLIMPAILSGFILTFSKSMGSFGVPAFLGLPIKYYTVSTMLHSSMQNRMIADAYILSIILLMVCACLIFFNQKAIGKRKSFATIGGKGSRTTYQALGKWKRLVNVSVLGGMSLAAFVPLLILFVQSFMTMHGDFSLSNFTLHYWLGNSDPSIASGEVGVLKNDGILTALKNSLKIGIIASIVAAFIGLLLGYVITQKRSSVPARLVEQLSFLPYLIPGIAFSAIYLSMFAKPFLFIPTLYGTVSLIILISIVNELPFATRAGSSTMYQIGGELEEAAVVQGIPWWRRFFSIILPLSKKGLFSSFLLLFISVMKELDLIILLVTPQTGTLTTLIFNYAEQGYQQYANAIMLIIVAIILAAYFIAGKVGKVDFSKGIGG